MGVRGQINECRWRCVRCEQVGVLPLMRGYGYTVNCVVRIEEAERLTGPVNRTMTFKTDITENNDWGSTSRSDDADDHAHTKEHRSTQFLRTRK